MNFPRIFLFTSAISFSLFHEIAYGNIYHFFYTLLDYGYLRVFPYSFYPWEAKYRILENVDLKWLLDMLLKGTISCRKVFGIDKVPLTRRPCHSRDSLLKTIRGHIALSC